ncbi:dihydrolipoamide acetyltransferase family protein [Isoptericola sp. b515]|uniref:dihydrolipoamide acetyltransferase family protein n=1 Tax=Isoptericola sp. b515 TaxID=3064652 RepID=UPI0027131E46|nr:dihydrolipoamide acetyltransferase family protein [Isoptericola sp. b515]MDO8147387.1 dihydrolipoamide acetyltransferase family protein [Isoptericola sp. b515]
MSTQRFPLPDVGEGLTEAEIVEWKVAVGDTVTVNQVVVEIETAKSLVELPSPWAGTVTGLLAEEGTTVDVGTPILEIGDGSAASPGSTAPEAPAQAAPAEPAAAAAGESSGSVLVGYGTADAGAGGRRRRRRGGASTAAATPPAPAGPPEVRQPAATPPAAETPAARSGPSLDRAMVSVPAASSPADTPTSTRARVLAKPPVRKLARDLGVDLASVRPTGPGGIVTREDVTAHAAAAAPRPLATSHGEDRPWTASDGLSADGRTTRVPVRSVRKRTAEAMVASAFTAPHVTVFRTVDVTRTMKLVERLKRDRDFADVRVTPLLIAAKAALLALQRHPEVNASWDEAAQEIVYQHYVNLGIAAATPRGLVVPNVKDAHRLELLGLAQALGELTATARAGRTSPADMADGTFTITNVGVFGIDTGTPILNPGESGILAVGAIRQQPWVHKGKVKPRWVTQLALSFDHRLVDGELGARFLSDVARVLEDPAQGLVWG